LLKSLCARSSLNKLKGYFCTFGRCLNDFWSLNTYYTRPILQRMKHSRSKSFSSSYGHILVLFYFQTNFYEIIQSHILTTPHNDFPSNYAFRLLYNGQVLTSKIENCSGDLCDLKVLLDLIEPFARLNRDCDSIESSIMTNTSSGQSVAAVSLPVMLVYTFLCCILSSVVTFFFTTGRLPLCNIRKLLKKHGKAAYGTFSPPSLSAQAESPNPSGIGGFQIESVKRGQNDETKLQESTHETLPSSRPDCANEHGSREVL